MPVPQLHEMSDDMRAFGALSGAVADDSHVTGARTGEPAEQACRIAPAPSMMDVHHLVAGPSVAVFERITEVRTSL